LLLLGGLGLLLGGGDGLLLGGGDGLLLGGVPPDVDGGVDGVLGFVGGGVDCVGQLALASITDPSGHVLVVGDVGGGVNVCVHDGSFGFFVQSTGGGVPVVQLPAAHVDPVDPAPGPPDAGIDVLLGCIAAVRLLGCDPVVVLVVVCSSTHR
jgi:hypothetical protein